MLKVINCILFFFMATCTTAFIKGNDCVTPYHEKATCVPTHLCNIVTSALATPTPQARKFIKDSQCGCAIGQVCCGSVYNENYTSLVNCDASPEGQIINTAFASNKTNLDDEAKKEITGNKVKQIFWTTSYLIKEKACVTPYKEKALCVPLHLCNVVTATLATFTPQAQQFVKDSKSGCDSDGLVCCGSFYNETSTPMTNSAPPAEVEKVNPSSTSDTVPKKETPGGISSPPSHPAEILPSQDPLPGFHPEAPNILTSTMMKFDEFPSVAALEYESKDSGKSAGFLCGGTIVNARYILTAAHCIADEKHVLIKVWLGMMNNNRDCINDIHDIRCIKTKQKIDVEETIIHEFYKSTDNYDIGLLRLKESIKFADNIHPFCIIITDYELPSISFLHPLFFYLFGTHPFNYRYPPYNAVSKKQSCVGGKDVGNVCKKDSLGPLMYDFGGVNHDIPWYQHGIVSYDSGCGAVHKSGVYIKISSFTKWINNKINNVTFNLGMNEPCSTPNNTIGSCVPLNICEVVYKAAFTKDKSGTDFATESHCDNNDNGALVCCQDPGKVTVPTFNSNAIPDQNSCGILKTEPRIGDTEIKNLAEFPWLAGIEFSPEHYNINEIRCVGTVIHKRYVLTSEDCLFTSRFKPINVWLGHWNSSVHNDCKTHDSSVDCRHPVQKIGIQSIIRYPFMKQGANDIALILLDNEIKFSDYISPICLPLPNFLPKLETGTPLTVPRWDKYTTGFVTNSDVMLKEEIASVANDQCNKMLEFNKQPVLDSFQMCAGAEGKLSCDRLIGSPLMRSYENLRSGRAQWYLEGIVAFVPSECWRKFKGYPGSYTNVTSYLDWIINIISED